MLGFIIVGGLLIVAGLTGVAVLRGTTSSYALVAFGVGIIGFGIVRQVYLTVLTSNFVRCPVCPQWVRNARLHDHLSKYHPWELEDEAADT